MQEWPSGILKWNKIALFTGRNIICGASAFAVYIKCRISGFSDRILSLKSGYA